MQVYIMRHGEAEMFADSDAERALNQNGIDEVKQVAQWLAKQITHLDYVLVSPFVRAQQTWKLMESYLPSCQQVIELTDLTPSGDELNVLALIEELALEKAKAQLLVVSHLPLVGYLVAGLSPDAGAPLFSTAAVAKIDFDGNNQLRYLQHPSMLAS